MLIDTALGRADVELSNGVSTSAWKALSDEWLSFKSEIESAGMSSGPLMKVEHPWPIALRNCTLHPLLADLCIAVTPSNGDSAHTVHAPRGNIAATFYSLLTHKYLLRSAHHPSPTTHLLPHIVYRTLPTAHSVLVSLFIALTTHHPPLTTCYPQPTTHYSPHSTHYSPPTTHHLLPTTYNSLLTS